MSALGYFEELCVALHHKWQPEANFVIFTAYMDEADTHDREPTIIMSAFLGHAYQWRRFEAKLVKIQREFGFRIFHAKHFKSRSGEFSGWPPEKCKRLIAELTELVSENLTEGLAVHLEYRRFKEEYRASPVPKGMNLDSQYGVCFRACLARIMTVLRDKGRKPTLHIVLERGNPHSGDCERIFNDFKMLWSENGSEFFGTFTLQDKQSCMPLMVADMLAATYSMMRARKAAGELHPNAYRLKGPQKGSLAFIELAPDALVNLKLGYEAMRQKRRDFWLAKRRANLSARTAALALTQEQSS